MISPCPLVLTVGHSTHALEGFVTLLKQHGVTAVADVRSAPYSRFNPQFNREDLAKSLLAVSIGYHFLGRELGARSDDPACYVNGRVQYDRLAEAEAFKIGIEQVMALADSSLLALVCAEKEPLECHRTLLVARALVARGVDVRHILPDGRLETHEAAMDRLLDIVGLPRGDMFRSRDEFVEEALARQEQKVAYVDERLASEASRGIA